VQQVQHRDIAFRTSLRQDDVQRTRLLERFGLYAGLEYGHGGTSGNILPFIGIRCRKGGEPMGLGFGRKHGHDHDNDRGCGDNWWWIIILIVIIFCFCGDKEDC